MAIGYVNNNVNPKKKKTGDCVIRAITTATGMKYEEVFDLLVASSKKTGYMINDKKNYEKVLDKLGWVKMKQPKKFELFSGRTSKYLVGEIDTAPNVTDEDLLRGIIITMAHHMTCVVDSHIFDIWDCRNKTISNYWVKRS